MTEETKARKAHLGAQVNWATSRDECREMMAVWPDIVRDLTEAGRHLDIPDATKWMAKVQIFQQFYYRLGNPDNYVCR